MQPLHALPAALRAHGLAELVGLAGREAGDVDGHLHELLLEQRHAERLGQRRLEQRVQVGDGLLAVAAADVGMDRAALDGTGTDEGDLDHQVVEGAGLEPGQGGHLGPALHLEHADGVGLAEHVEDCVVLGDLGQVDRETVGAGHEVDGAVQGGEHPEAEQVELHQPGRGAVVLVPLEHGAVLHAGPLDRAHLDDGAVTQHHAAGVDAEVPGSVLDLHGHLEHGGGDVVAGDRRVARSVDRRRTRRPIRLLRPSFFTVLVSRTRGGGTPGRWTGPPRSRRPDPTGRPSSPRHRPGRGRSREPWPCRARRTWPGR